MTLTNEAPSAVLAINLTLFPCIGVIIGLVMSHFKERIGLMILRKRRVAISEGYLPLAVVGDREDSRQRDRAE